MRIFVTGGAGFIGRYLAKAFLEKGHPVTIYDNLSNSSEDKIIDLIDSGVNFVKSDINDIASLEKFVKDHDVVIHLAAKISVEDSILHPDETRCVNVDGTINVLNACIKNKVKNFIAMSTAAVYGDSKEPRIFLSEDSETKPLSPYGLSKLKMEECIREFSEKYSINSVCLRIFNVYGHDQSEEYAGVITKFTENIRHRRPLIIYGDGQQTRDFVEISDTVTAIYNALLKINGKKGKVYNIGSGSPVTIEELAKLMLSISGKDLEIQHVQPKKGEIRYSQADISLAKKELGYFPAVSLREGLRKLLNET